MARGSANGVNTATLGFEAKLWHAADLMRGKVEEDDGEPFKKKMERLPVELGELFGESTRLEAEIKANLKAIGYGV